MKNLAFLISATALICGVVAMASGSKDEGQMPALDGAVAWVNSAPLSNKALRGKVVLVNFWTYSCINSLRELPYMKAWAAKYKDAGLVVIGVHAPEFGFEADPTNVKNAVSDLKVAYPIPIDSNHSIWRAFRNEYWPANYFVDAKGRIRYHVPAQREMERERSPLVSIPPLRGGDFQGIGVYRSDVFWGRARKASLRAQHRLDEPTKLSLGVVASLQSPLPFHLARSL